MRRLINVFGKMMDGACHSVFVSMVCFGFGRRLCRPGHLYAVLRFLLSMPLVMTR